MLKLLTVVFLILSLKKRRVAELLDPSFLAWNYAKFFKIQTFFVKNAALFFLISKKSYLYSRWL